MKELLTFEDVEKVISKQGIVLLYASRNNCGVCTALKPKILEILKSFPEIESYYINLDSIPLAAGQLSLFTIPGILLFVDGKETIREARYVSIDDLSGKIRRIYDLY